MNKIKNITVAFALLLTGCAGQLAGARTSVDRFNGVTINTISNNALPLGFLEQGTMYIDPRQEVYPDGSRKYFMVVQWSSMNSAVVFSPGESMIFLADGERIGFEKMEIISTRKEGVFFVATEEKMRKIGSAKKLEVRLVGFRGNYERELAAKNVENFRLFKEKFIDSK